MKKNAPVGLRRISVAVFAAFSLQISGCTALNDPAVTGLESLKKSFQSIGAAAQVQKVADLQAASEKASHSLENVPQLEGKASADPVAAADFVKANQDKVVGYLSSTEDQSSDLRKFIFEVSKEAAQTNDSLLQAQDDALLFYALQIQASFHRSVIQKIVPVMIYAGATPIKDVPEVTSFRAAVAQHYFQHFGAQMVSQSDSKKVVGNLQDLKKNGLLPGYVETNIQTAQTGMQTQLNQNGKSVSDMLRGMKQDQQDSMKKSVQSLLAGFENATFLYTDELHFSPAENFLIVVGNLSWGLINTLIGAGIVVGDEIFAAITAGQIVSYPQFSLSSNGHMIHVEMDGGNPLGLDGEMSLGLFELDNGTDGFASAHEGIHGVQSAILGPLYLPTILFTYAISGFDQGFMEAWAWDWAWMD